MARRKVNVVVVGSVNMDLVVRVREMPRPGETLIGRDFRQVPGGKGANQAVACTRLGAKTAFVGRVGNDGFGSALRAHLQQDGVSTDHLETDLSACTGVALIMVDETGENSIVVASGANANVGVGDVEAAKRLFDKADFVVVQLEIPMETVDAALAAARKRGVTSILDAGPAKKCPEEILRKADIVSPNEIETEALTGRTITDLESAERAATALREMGVPKVVLKLGEQGAMVADGNEHTHVPALEIEPVDSTAAGDAFTGALAVALGEGKELIEATRFACFAGALACLKIGAQPSLPTRHELEDFIKSR